MIAKYAFAITKLAGLITFEVPRIPVGVPVTPRRRMSRGKVLRKDGFPGFHMQKNRSVNLAEDGGHPTRSSRLRGATRGTWGRDGRAPPAAGAGWHGRRVRGDGLWVSSARWGTADRAPGGPSRLTRDGPMTHPFVNRKLTRIPTNPLKIGDCIQIIWSTSLGD